MIETFTTYKGAPFKIWSETEEARARAMNDLGKTITRQALMFRDIVADTTGAFTEEEKQLAQNWLDKLNIEL